MANSFAVKVIATKSDWSTITKDTTPAQFTSDQISAALHLFQLEVDGFARTMIHDPKMRLDYVKKSTEAAREILEKVKARQITPYEAALTINAMRNQLMEMTRAQLSDLGLAISESMKKSGKLMAELQDEYARRLFQRSFESLTQAEKEAVWTEIVHAAGRPRKKMTAGAKKFGVAGRALLIASLAIAVYNIIEAEDKKRQTVKEGVTLGAGVAGGAAGGVAAAFIVSSPPGWVVGIAMFVGAALLGVGASDVFDYFWPEK